MTLETHAHGFTPVGNVTPDRLYDRFEVRRQRTLKAGQGVLARGTALGKISAGPVAPLAGNAGNGTLTLDASTPLIADFKVGTYAVRCIAAAANGGTFRVTDPDGEVLGDTEVGAPFADHLRLSIADGGVDFIVGDGFDITISADAGKWVKSASATQDGSHIVRGVLLHDVDTTDGDSDGIIGRRGRCNGAALILGAGHTVASIDEDCLERGIILETIIG